MPGEHGPGPVRRRDELKRLVVGRRPDHLAGTGIRDPSGPRENRSDAVILNGRSVPNRNIDGALSEGAANALFAQPLDEESTKGRYWSAYNTASAWLSERGESS